MEDLIQVERNGFAPPSMIDNLLDDEVSPGWTCSDNAISSLNEPIFQGRPAS